MDVTHKIYFQPNESNDGNSQSTAAGKEPAAFWDGEVTKLMWTCRWAAKGLMPVKPGVFLKDSLVLAPGRAIRIQ